MSIQSRVALLLVALIVTLLIWLTRPESGGLREKRFIHLGDTNRAMVAMIDDTIYHEPYKRPLFIGYGDNESITSGDRNVVLLRDYLDLVEKQHEYDSVSRRWSRKGYKVTERDCLPFWQRALCVGREIIYLGPPRSHIEKDTVTITGIDRNTAITSGAQNRVIEWIGGNRFVIWESRFPGP
jgi:hypothetical protein